MPSTPDQLTHTEQLRAILERLALLRDDIQDIKRLLGASTASKLLGKLGPDPISSKSKPIAAQTNKSQWPALALFISTQNS
jgi:hypothetical protein